MANTKKAKAETESEIKDVKEPKEIDDNKKVAELEALIAKQQEQLKTMQSMMDKINTVAPQTVTVVQDKGLSGRKIKIVSCLHCTLNLKGKHQKPYTFKNFGEFRNLRFDDLEECVHNHPESAKRGDFYICDPEAVAELGLSDEYENMYNADEVNDIIHFKNGEMDVDKILGMVTYDTYTGNIIDATRRDDAIKQITDNIAHGEQYDMNYVIALKDKSGVDIDDLIQKAKDLLDITSK